LQSAYLDNSQLQTVNWYVFCFSPFRMSVDLLKWIPLDVFEGMGLKPKRYETIQLCSFGYALDLEENKGSIFRQFAAEFGCHPGQRN
jgi:hypothetical protein